jgi:RNA polymerase sigma-70 factor (ECF subfamily)
MVFGKSIAFDENGLSEAARAGSDSAFTAVENGFLEKLRAGEADAFDTLVCRYSVDIYALLVRMTQNPDEAGDLTQETFLRAFKAIRHFRGESELKTWLFRIAINESRNRHRWWKRRYRDKTVSLDEPQETGEDLVAREIAVWEDDPEKKYSREELADILNKAVDSLKPSFRTVFVLRDIEELSTEETAETLGISISAVKSRLLRARLALREKLTKQFKRKGENLLDLM